MSNYDEENLTLAELLADPEYANRNSDITTEEFRMILADEMSVEDILWRRDEAKRAAERAERQRLHGIAVKERMEKFSSCPTPSLLYKYRAMRTDCRNGYGDEVDLDAMREVLKTREHVETDKKKKAFHRRQMAMKNRGQGKSKNRGGRR